MLDMNLDVCGGLKNMDQGISMEVDRVRWRSPGILEMFLIRMFLMTGGIRDLVMSRSETMGWRT